MTVTWSLYSNWVHQVSNPSKNSPYSCLSKSGRVKRRKQTLKKTSLRNLWVMHRHPPYDIIWNPVIITLAKCLNWHFTSTMSREKTVVKHVNCLLKRERWCGVGWLGYTRWWWVGSWGAHRRHQEQTPHFNIPSPPKLLLQLLEGDYSVGRIFLLHLVLCPILNIHNVVSLSPLASMLSC